MKNINSSTLIYPEKDATLQDLEKLYNIPTVHHVFKSSLDNVCAFYIGYNFSQKIEGLFGLGVSFINIEQKTYFEGNKEEALICKTNTGVPLNVLIGIKYNFNDKLSFNLMSIGTSLALLNFQSSSQTEKTKPENQHDIKDLHRG